MLVNGVPGLLHERDGQAVSIAHLTVVGGRVVALDILADPRRLARLDLPAGDLTVLNDLVTVVLDVGLSCCIRGSSHGLERSIVTVVGS